MIPKRLQMSRAKGWSKPSDAVYVGRPTRWGNPFRVGMSLCETIEDTVTAFRAVAADGGIADIEYLRGKDLLCWCRPGAPCHADVLLELANASSRVGPPAIPTHAAAPDVGWPRDPHGAGVSHVVRREPSGIGMTDEGS